MGGREQWGSWVYAWVFGSICGAEGLKEFREHSQLRKLSLELWVLSPAEEKFSGWSSGMLTNLGSGDYEGRTFQRRPRKIWGPGKIHTPVSPRDYVINLSTNFGID